MNNTIKILCNIFLFSIFLVVGCFGQWSNDFNSGNFDEWSGDISDFIVNEDLQLQLNAPAAGEAYIYRSSFIDFDTVTFSFYHLLDFAPSDNNQSRIYLALDNNDITIANGYFIEIGENGSADALKFYFLENGAETFIGSATMGALASEPAQVFLQIDVYPDGLWSVKSNYEGGEFLSLETEFFDSQFSLRESLIFGISCKFSASRADKFFYDNMSVQAFVPDNTPPVVTEAFTIDENNLLVNFSEPVLESEALNIENYDLNNFVGNPESITEIGAFGNQYRLTFGADFDSSLNYVLNVSGISDLNENEMEDQMISFLYAVSPSEGEVLISEILFDPYSGGEDFVEIYNNSDKNLDINGIVISNSQNGENKIINNLSLPPKAYLALTEDVDFLVQEYKPDVNARIEFQELPAFNNDMGNVTLSNSLGVVLDLYNYDEDQHFQLIDDTEGVSLERISFDIEAEEGNNWQSAAENVRYATPGYENSNSGSIAIGELNFELKTETFSPNQDGEEDQMIVTYNLEKSGFLANIIVYDAAGFKIKELSSNELLAKQGIITWDGTTNDGQIADLGIYIIIGNIFHPDGETKDFKLTTVLADYID